MTQALWMLFLQRSLRLISNHNMIHKTQMPSEPNGPEGFCYILFLRL